MAKVTVYLPDELAERVRASGITMSPVCQRALREAIKLPMSTPLQASPLRSLVNDERS